MKREATFRFKTLTVHDEAVNCLNVNDYVFYRQDVQETVYIFFLIYIISFDKFYSGK